MQHLDLVRERLLWVAPYKSLSALQALQLLGQSAAIWYFGLVSIICRAKYE